MGRHYRNPRTRQERRVNGSREYRRVEIRVGGELHEFRIRVRGKRSPMMLPAWHDMPRGIQRSWKRHRRTQRRTREVPADQPEGLEQSPIAPERH
jgi:hypothetical protein